VDWFFSWVSDECDGKEYRLDGHWGIYRKSEVGHSSKLLKDVIDHEEIFTLTTKTARTESRSNTLTFTKIREPCLAHEAHVVVSTKNTILVRQTDVKTETELERGLNVKATGLHNTSCISRDT
jgi:5'(3')-deoxyribonucleotidase